jgi:hypothetical protein
MQRRNGRKEPRKPPHCLWVIEVQHTHTFFIEVQLRTKKRESMDLLPVSNPGPCSVAKSR